MHDVMIAALITVIVVGAVALAVEVRALLRHSRRDH
jgi:hypothetical protein